MDKKKAAAKALGSNWLEMLQAEDGVLETFSNQLDDDFYAICNVLLLEEGPGAGMLLFGPTGVWVFEFVHQAGSFKAEGDQWSALDEKTTEYQPVEPNPILAARDNATAVYEYLHSKSLPVPWVNPVLLLTNPDVSFTNTGAVATPVRSDEVFQFIVQEVRALETLMDENDLAQVYKVFQPFIGSNTTPGEGVKPKATHFLGMTAMQWTVILSVIVVNLCLIVSFVWWYVSNRP